MRTLAVAALTSTLALAACGGAAAPAPATQAAAPAANATAAAPAAPVATQPAAAAAASAPVAAGPARKVTIGATNDAYSIQTLEVKPGEKIEFVVNNAGDEKHNLVGVGEGVSLVSPDLDPGNLVSWTWTAPTKPMTFKFICSFHAKVPPIQIVVK
jgi:plastocyanin